MKKAVKILCLALVAVMVLSTAAFAAQGDVSVYHNGNKLTFDQNPIIVDSRTLVPLRVIFEAMGAEVLWDDPTKTVTAIRGDVTVTLTINDNILYKNGEAITLDVPAQIVNERTLVPVRAISESFGAYVDWNDKYKNVVVMTDALAVSAVENVRALSSYMVEGSVTVYQNDAPIKIDIKVGTDYTNKKEYMYLALSTDAASDKQTMVAGEEITYLDKNGVLYTNPTEGTWNPASLIDTGASLLYESEAGDEVTYNVIVSGNDVGTMKIVVDKNTGAPLRAVISKDVFTRALGIEATANEDFVGTITTNTTEIMDAWNTYSAQ